MVRKLILALVALFLSVGMAWATDANTATKDELDAVKGIGPTIAQRIVDERQKNGPFKSLDDLQERVKGVGPATVKKLAAQGLTVGGSSATAAAPKSKAAAEKTATATPDANAAASKKTAKSEKAADKATAADKAESSAAASSAKGRKKKAKAADAKAA